MRSMGADWNSASLKQAAKYINGFVTRAHSFCRRAGYGLSTSANEDLALILFEDATGMALSPIVALPEQHW